ncbi:MAG: hypothetical protein AB8C46_20525 [Burkholderiaceae bacterium]
MIATFPALAVVLSLAALLTKVHRRDPFADTEMRAFLFAGFRAQRRLAWIAGALGALILLGLSLMVDLLDSTLGQSAMLVLSLYLLVGIVRAALNLDKLSFDSRDSDPVLKALTNIVRWPLWKQEP